MRFGKLWDDSIRAAHGRAACLPVELRAALKRREREAWWWGDAFVRRRSRSHPMAVAAPVLCGPGVKTVYRCHQVKQTVTRKRTIRVDLDSEAERDGPSRSCDRASVGTRAGFPPWHVPIVAMALHRLDAHPCRHAGPCLPAGRPILASSPAHPCWQGCMAGRGLLLYPVACRARYLTQHTR
jgi:hypothetical protein